MVLSVPQPFNSPRYWRGWNRWAETWWNHNALYATSDSRQRHVLLQNVLLHCSTTTHQRSYYNKLSPGLYLHFPLGRWWLVIPSFDTSTAAGAQNYFLRNYQGGLSNGLTESVSKARIVTLKTFIEPISSNVCTLYCYGLFPGVGVVKHLLIVLL